MEHLNGIIPREFSLFGYKIEVSFVDDLLEETGNLGEAHYSVGKILLQNPATSPQPMSDEFLMQTFYHEKVHFLLNVLNDKNATNERYVEIMAGLLYQMDRTSSGVLHKPNYDKRPKSSKPAHRRASSKRKA